MHYASPITIQSSYKTSTLSASTSSTSTSPTSEDRNTNRNLAAATETYTLSFPTSTGNSNDKGNGIGNGNLLLASPSDLLYLPDAEEIDMVDGRRPSYYPEDGDGGLSHYMPNSQWDADRGIGLEVRRREVRGMGGGMGGKETGKRMEERRI
jgi:hypothetical protein